MPHYISHISYTKQTYVLVILAFFNIFCHLKSSKEKYMSESSRGGGFIYKQ